MKILVIGSGAREHALCWAIKSSPLCEKLYCTPGNPGIEEEAICIDIAITNLLEIVEFCDHSNIDFVVIGPEAPLVDGLVDRLDSIGVKAFGPNAAAARLEGSKSFTKEFCNRHSIPTAKFKQFNQFEAALNYVRQQGAPIVIKADGLAAGKGVTVALSLAEAEDALINIFKNKVFGSAGNEVVIEERLIGEEASFHALIDGENILPLAAAQDHKPVGDGDKGPNTGGMGAYSPPPIIDSEMRKVILNQFIKPTVDGMAMEGNVFKGVLYAGLMVTKDGPKLIEYNTRFGDPECQVILTRLKSDLLPALIACADGELANFDLRWNDAAAVCVVMATNGYPADYKTGSSIRNIREAEIEETVKIFHAGTRKSTGGEIVSNGGRVLGITALGPTIDKARDKAYRAVRLVDWKDGFYRTDIGWRALRGSDG